MSLPQVKTTFGPDEYLVWEQAQVDRHDYVDGEIFAMSGASDAHGTAALNLASMLNGALRGTPCKPFIADMKVRVEAANCFFYPDILVTCDPRDRAPEASHVKHHPALIVEILSPSTEAYDRGNKFAAYRQLESLQEYVLVSIEARRIEVFRRDASGHWVLHPFALDEAIELASIDFRCPVAEVFEGVEGE
jgi:Uma2 family endonuclease